MKYIKQNQTMFAAAAVAMIVMAVVASRQFFLFVSSPNADPFQGAQAGRYHLWLAAAAILLASFAACLMFIFFLGRGRSKRHEVLLSPLGPAPTLIDINPNANSTRVDLFNAIRWAQQNEWCIEGQADDRRPMNGNVGASPGSASAQRSAARLTHQGMFRKWARERHD